MTPLRPLTLTGRLVRLEPLHQDHLDGLVAAARDGQLWDRWYTGVASPEDMTDQIEERLRLQKTGWMLPFTTVRQSDNTVIGATTFCDIEPSVPRVEIGYTWNRESVHGTGTNAESKLLLMTHAFEALGCECVKFQTHWMNQQSRAAIERLGAHLDGVLRCDSIDAAGRLRDTVVYSVVAREWPMVKAGLEHRLRHRH
ncbi:GNAT family N-acetyltransferase [Leekyejoonella antrihumi]|uniref:GNAT family N-acetyltransferase n=1 Tax=Leekyejoonella antrihumi TaxID=1660198 RepID=A0A563E605_9MICO|nr:GNAT family protein [Leekyejoonella antrihumi]TWP37729.1 GNAT family N-acetyltransferase [Leekyejoonella antrihumi]